VCPAAARADDAAARAYFEPQHPIAFFALSAGFGGMGAGSAQDAHGQPYGYGGFRGTLAARGDLEALSPLWLSISGRTFGLYPAEAMLDASVGYQFQLFATSGDAAHPQYDRFQLRPLIGLKAIRFADSVDAPTTSRTTAVRAGFDWTLNGDGRAKKWSNVWRAHLVGLWDPAREQAGVEFETTAGFSLNPRRMDGGFIGVDAGYLPSTGGYGLLELGASWEIGRPKRVPGL
jgi:hypothetical protein